jgi:type II secretory pathway component GspD/PulD (secretin)/tetratricopeptide (TPR) repeat protein
MRLFNTGQNDLAAKYLKAASDYRDQLQPSEQSQLDDYLAKMSPAAAPAPAAAPSDAAVRPATSPSDIAVGAATDAGKAPAPVPSTETLGRGRPTADSKQEARWKLQAAREQLRQGNYDAASRIVEEVQGMNIKWGLFDETPAKMAEAIAKARPKASPSSMASTGAHDRREAQAKLKEAQDLMASNQFDQAEAIALEVESWNVAYRFRDVKPMDVAKAARALRKRDAIRDTPLKAQPSTSLYDVLVSEARQLGAAGKLDEAEAKARQAQKMNVVPSLTSDRAEAVLADIATARTRMPAPAPAASPSQPTAVAAAPARSTGSETPSVIAEREANELLAKGDNDAASAKFVQADTLRQRELAAAQSGRPTAVDLNVQLANSAPPALDGPASMPAPAPAQAAPSAPLATAPAPSPLTLEAPAPAPAPMPAPIDVPASPPAPGSTDAMPAPDPLAAPSIKQDAPAPGNKGEELLSQAKALITSGNFPAAREKATEAKSGGYGVDALAEEMLAQIALSEQGGALAVYEAALDALRKNDVPRARMLLTEVANSGTTLDEGMLQKVQDLLAKLPKDGAGKAMASDVALSDAESLKAQQMNKEVGDKVAEARRLMETDPDKAIATLQATLVAVKAAELPPTIARTMTRRVEVAIELAKKDKIAFDQKMLDKNAKIDIETKKLRILEADKSKQAAITDLMKKAEQAQSDANWAKAEELARRAAEIDPNNVAATILAYKANLQRHYETYNRDKREKEEGFLEAMHGVDEAMIINKDALNGGISMPKNFRELSERRRKFLLDDKMPRDPKSMAIAKKLEEPISLNLADQTLGEAITFIQNYTGLNVILDPKALNDEGLSRDSKVNLNVTSVRLRTALKFMLRPLGLTYKVEDDVLLITSPQASQDRTVTWTYPVADLVISPNRANSSANQIVSAQPQTDPLTTQSIAGLSPTSNMNSPITVLQNQKQVTVQDMMPLMQLISNTIAPGTWRMMDTNSSDGDGAYGMGGAFGGGGAGGDAEPAQPGSITPFLLSISLIIRHTAEVHEEVAELLKQLRRLQDLQVSVEVRFITVSDDFFEQIGVNFDFNIQSKAYGAKTTAFAPSGSTQAATYPFNLVSNTGTTTGGGTTGGTTGGGTTGGGTTGGGTTGGGTTGGGTTGGGTTGGGGGGGTTGTGGGGTGAGGISGGGFAGGGGGTGGAGIGGGGGGTTGGTTGGGSSSSSQVGYVVNPFLDNALGRRTPTIVGLQSGGLANYTPNLGIPFVQGSANNIAPFNAIPSAGATFGISFLSDLEAYLFLTAAQGDARNNIVQAPKVTTFNGSTATIFNAQQQSYVATLTPIVAAGAVAFTPTIGTLPDGVTLTVTPVVSADRRYVRLSLAPFFQAVNQLQSFSFGGAAVGGGGLGGLGTPLTTTVQLPQTTTTTLNTTVTVPDGGTVLLGGVKRMREQRLEYGVPVLAKTPLINRLFRNIGIGRRTDSLMLMVTPKIIILEEEEDRLGVRTVAPNP